MSGGVLEKLFGHYDFNRDQLKVGIRRSRALPSCAVWWCPQAAA